MPSPILARTKNFFSLYHHICGKTEVPDVYHHWACMALLSAALEDRVWFNVYKDEPLKPNLYICLIGPGSLGKGMAISQAVKLAKQSLGIRIYRGKLTYAHLIDVLGEPFKDDFGNEYFQNPKLWLVNDEFKNAVGSNRLLAEDMIALLTEAYTATNYTIQIGTRTHGEVKLEKPLLNWLMGSTEVWLRQVLTREVFESGFVARGCFIFSDYDLDKRIRKPAYPEDYDQVYAHLKARLWMLQRYRGPFDIIPTADNMMEEWYDKRPQPEDEMLYSSWKRQYEMLVRFSMIHCLAEGQDMIIRTNHVARALSSIEQIARSTARLIEVGVETLDVRPINDVGKYIKKVRSVKHSDLLRYMRAKKSYNASKVKASLNSLVQEGRIEVGQTPKGGLKYDWIADST